MSLINCLECSKEISDKSSICPHCGSNEHRNGKGKIIYLFIGIVALSAFVGMKHMLINNSEYFPKDENIINTNEENKNLTSQETNLNYNGDNQSAESEEDVILQAKIDKEKKEFEEFTESTSSWKYELINDSLRGKVYEVSLLSQNKGIENNVSPMKITLKERPSNNVQIDMDIILSVNNADFFCNKVSNTCNIMVRFDDKIYPYFFNYGAGVKNKIFITSRGHFLQMLQNSQTMAIEAPFNNIGNKQFEFDIRGLELNN